MDRSTSRRYGIEIGEIKIDSRDLDLIRQEALQMLLDEQGFDVPRAWTNAVIAYLTRNGHIKP